MSWTAKAAQPTGCFLGAALKSPTDTAVNEGDVSQDVATTANGQTRIFGLKAGTYFEFITTHCDWTIDITKR